MNYYQILKITGIILLNEDVDIKSNDRLIIYLLHKKDFSKLAKLLQVSIGFF